MNNADQPRRKWPRTSKSGGSENNKKRGRPRVEKQDESAAADVGVPSSLIC